MELGLTWNEVADRADLTKEGLRTVRQGNRKMMPLTKRGIETALRWQPGSVDATLGGGEPVKLPAVDSPPGPPSFSAQVKAPAPSAERRVPPWFAKEVERQGWMLDSLTIDQLRALAHHFGYTVAELMLNAGLASERDLEIEERPTSPPESEALADFDAAMERLISNPLISRRQRKEAEEFAARTREEAIKKIQGDV
ncbi:hypothetical protein [Streptosporangium roseum]|uniref:hypothetical protein n=1 Tax=Streptosporangium roseum TaxID=2001 RepID=UPI00333240C4